MELTNKKNWKTTLLTLGGVSTLIAGCSSTTPAEEARQKAIESSPQWKEGKFQNTLPRQDGSIWEMLKKGMFGDQDHNNPTIDYNELVQFKNREDFKPLPPTGLDVTWMGHSSILLEIDGHRVLTDPVWSQRTSPFQWIGPSRFHKPPVPIEQLPNLDAIVISHDHYDHLDEGSIKQLINKTELFVVPLGVGNHLEDWGVPAEKIRELDWWQNLQHKGLTLTATPARHFSGRLSPNSDKTLWAGWSIVGTEHKVFYSGDTGMFPGFEEIGDRLGPFDLTMMETGAYDELWCDVHMGPEQAVLAHQMVKGKAMLPVHWGTFNLANHNWTEPMERVIAAAHDKGVPVFNPKPGETFNVNKEAVLEAGNQLASWWPQLPWQNKNEHKVMSTGLSKELRATPETPGSPR